MSNKDFISSLNSDKIYVMTSLISIIAFSYGVGLLLGKLHYHLGKSNLTFSSGYTIFDVSRTVGRFVVTIMFFYLAYGTKNRFERVGFIFGAMDILMSIVGDFFKNFLIAIYGIDIALSIVVITTLSFAMYGRVKEPGGDMAKNERRLYAKK